MKILKCFKLTPPHDSNFNVIFLTASDAWSSLTPPPQPEVLTQAYAFPTSIVTMATTQTKRGITTKTLLGRRGLHSCF